MRKWTEEERRLQAERIREIRPWEKSTGPKTRDGKERSRMNAFKHGNRSEARRVINKALREQANFLRGVAQYLAAEARQEEWKSVARKRTIEQRN